MRQSKIAVGIQPIIETTSFRLQNYNNNFNL